MKRILFFASLLQLVFIQFVNAQNIGINESGATPDATAILDINATDKGILIPRTDTTAVNGAGTPSTGLLIYQASDNTFYYYNTTKWIPFITSETLISDTLPVIKDEDGDTYVHTEENADEDAVRIGIKGTEMMAIDSNGMLVYGTYSGGTVPDLNDGTRMTFYPANASFRTGYVSGTQWNDSLVGNYSVAFGLDNISSGKYTLTQGRGNVASGDGDVAIGYQSVASGRYSFAEGVIAEATGYVSFAAGFRTDASGIGSVGMGYRSQANGDYSFATNYQSYANGNSSFAAGYRNLASGDYSLAFGSQTEATELYSSSFGVETLANGRATVVFGHENVAHDFAEMVLGQFNETSTGDSTGWQSANNIFTIGNGSNNTNRSNSYQITADGNTYIGGSLSINGLTDTISFPTTDGAAGQVMTSDGLGTLTWGNTVTDTLPLIADTDRDTYIHTEANADEDYIRFFTDSNEVMTADNAGNIGIGINTPTSTLHVYMGDNGDEVLDQSSGGGATNFSNGVTNRWQSFTAGNDGNLSKVSLYFKNWGGYSRSISIYDGEGTGGSLLYDGSGTTLTTVGSGSWLEWPVSGVEITAGQQYTIYLNENSGGLTYKTSNNYDGGRAGWNSNHDARFRAYVEVAKTGFAVDDAGVHINNYILPQFDGDSGQVIISDGTGSLSWTDQIVDTDTDDQFVDTFQLSGNNLELSIDGDGAARQIVDLSGYLDADNLGNHTATTNIQLSGNWLSSDGDSEGIYADVTGNIGIGLSTPEAFLDITGSNTANGPTTSLMLRSGNGSTTTDSEQIIFGYNGTSSYGHSIKTRHNGGAETNNAIDFYLWDQSTDAITSVGTKRVLTLDGTGYVGIGTASPSSLTEISSGTSGDALLTISADSDNNDENDNPGILLSQDGGSFVGYVGLEGDAGARYTNTLANAMLIAAEATVMPIQFATNNAVGMTLDGDGKVGIGVTGPTGKLTIKDSLENALTIRSHTDNSEHAGLAFQNTGGFYAWSIHRENSVDDLVFRGGHSQSSISNLAEVMRLNRYGVGIVGGTSTATNALEVGTNGDGTIARANAWNTFSDRRWKTNFATIPNALDKIEHINGYYYNWKNRPDTSIQVGVIAQEIEVVLPQIVSTDENGYKSVDYSKLTALLIQAVKEQQVLIEALQADNKNKNEVIGELRKQVDTNTAQIDQIHRLMQMFAQAKGQ